MPEHKFALVLHSHIPYVLAHGSWPHGMDWLYEAAAESYLPLLDVFLRLRDEGIVPGINISFTPVLVAQLKDPVFKKGFSEYLAMKIAIAENDRASFEETGNTKLAALAAFWQVWYEKQSVDFHGRCHEDIIEGFRVLQDQGQIEVLTSAATHGYFPLLSRDESIRHQVRQGMHTYRRHFGREARSFWIPECAYRPAYSWKSPFGGKEAADRRGVDEILGSEGVRCFFVDGHLLKGGEAKGVYLDRFPGLKLLWEKFQGQYSPAGESGRDPYVPYLAHPSNTPFLVRDEISGAQVWSRDMGYPGDGWYLEFHKKHFPGGMRYWRITASGADLADKLPYDPGRTRERLEEHARHFVSVLESLMRGREEGIVVALYDTELFGHWWFEGPEWLYLVLKGLNRSFVHPGTVSAALEAIPPRTIVSLPEGSWGKGGFHWIWLNQETSWIWEKIYEIEDDALKFGSGGGLNKRVWKQFIREKFLLESSDWPFLVSTWAARDYAELRAAEHYERARTLAAWLKRGGEIGTREAALLATYENEDRLFEEVVGPDGRIV